MEIKKGRKKTSSVTRSNDSLSSSRDDEFRLYDMGNDDDETSNILIGVWNINQKNYSSVGQFSNFINLESNWTSTLLFESRSTLLNTSLETFNFSTSYTMTQKNINTSNESNLYHSISQIVSEPFHGRSYVSKGTRDVTIKNGKQIVTNEDNDYGTGVLSNGDSILENEYFIHSATEYPNVKENTSFHQILREQNISNALESSKTKSGSTFMLLLEDFEDYFLNFNESFVHNAITSNNSKLSGLEYNTNCTNSSIAQLVCPSTIQVEHNYWALILILFPILTLFGNILVIVSIYRERSLQTVTNYFIVSLAIADLLVAVVVMPFAVYVIINGVWALPNFVCDFYIAMDVICSTSSIFNLVAISIDRYIAVTKPIKYAKHKNSSRVCFTILIVWAISAAIGSPIVLGLNNTPNRDPDLCVFYNTDFILYSSLSSFYIPCIIMVFLYWNIFKALRDRARKQRAARTPHLSELGSGNVIENFVQTKRLVETDLANVRRCNRVMNDDAPTMTASGSIDDQDENVISSDTEDCHVIANDKSTEFALATVAEESGNSAAINPLPSVRCNVLESMALARNDSDFSSVSKLSRKDKKPSRSSRFTIYKVHKTSRKKNEKSTAKRERKATKTLAIVLGVFLFCWLPFFTCNIMDAMCAKFDMNCRPGVTAFILTTWLGYINSFVNPVIYTIFNPEFRKAFKKIMHIG